MKSLIKWISVLLFLCSVITAPALVSVYVSADYLDSQPFAVKQVSLTPTNFPSTHSTTFVVGDRVTKNTASDGSVTFANVYPGIYQADFRGGYKVSSVWIEVPDETGTSNIVDLITTVINSEQVDTTYTKTQIDALIAAVEGGTSLTNVSETADDVSVNANLIVTDVIYTTDFEFIGGDMTGDANGVSIFVPLTINANILTTGFLTNTAGNIVLFDNVDITGATTADSLTVTNTFNLLGSLSDSSGNVTVNDSVDISGDLDVTGALTAGSLDVGTLTVTDFIGVFDYDNLPAGVITNGHDAAITVDSSFTANGIELSGVSVLTATDGTVNINDDTDINGTLTVASHINLGESDKIQFVSSAHAIYMTGDTLFIDADSATLATLGSSTLTAKANFAVDGNTTIGNASSDTITFNTVKGIPAEIGMACGDETSDLDSTGVKFSFRMPYAMTITSLYASANTAPVGTNVEIDVDAEGNRIHTADLVLAISDYDVTVTSMNGLYNTVAKGDAITIDVTQAATSGGAGLKVWIIGVKN